LAELSEGTHFETLQLSPAAEPEVIAAAYRALAKKYHPDRSSAPDAMARMARINGAYQALRGRIGRVTASDGRGEPPPAFHSPLSQDRIDPAAPLEEILSAITRIVADARQSVIEEVTSDGLPRDVATTLVATALRAIISDGADSRKGRSRKADVRLDPGASYDDALRTVIEKAQIVRGELADELVKDGLNRNAAMELSDLAFERIRHKTQTSAPAESRLTSERVDLAMSLDAGVRVVSGKLRAARQLVIDELARDGIPLRTADQLVEAATQSPVKGTRR